MLLNIEMPFSRPSTSFIYESNFSCTVPFFIRLDNRFSLKLLNVFINDKDIISMDFDLLSRLPIITILPICQLKYFCCQLNIVLLTDLKISIQAFSIIVNTANAIYQCGWRAMFKGMSANETFNKS